MKKLSRKHCEGHSLWDTRQNQSVNSSSKMYTVHFVFLSKVYFRVYIRTSRCSVHFASAVYTCYWKHWMEKGRKEKYRKGKMSKIKISKTKLIQMQMDRNAKNESILKYKSPSTLIQSCMLIFISYSCFRHFYFRYFSLSTFFLSSFFHPFDMSN